MSIITQMIKKLDLPDEICDIIDSYNEFIHEDGISKRFTKNAPNVVYIYQSPKWYSRHSLSNLKLSVISGGYLYDTGHVRAIRYTKQKPINYKPVIITILKDYSFSTYQTNDTYFYLL